MNLLYDNTTNLNIIKKRINEKLDSNKYPM